MGIGYRLDHSCATPVLLCDQCGWEIQDGAAHVVYQALDGERRYRVGDYVTPAFVHRNCRAEYQHIHGPNLLSDELGRWLIYLKNDTGITKQIERRAMDTIRHWANVD